MKRAFITGITGQDGSYLAELLLEKCYEVHGMVRRASTFGTERIEHVREKLNLHYGDITDASSVFRLISEIEPDEVYNLAAQSHVRVSFDQPAYTTETIVQGTLHVLEAVRHLTRTKEVRLYQASSSEMFGDAAPPQNERTPFQPVSPYACAKVAAHHLVIAYRNAYNLHASCGILFNHESPRRGETFVTRKIAKGVARIAAGLQQELVLGNLFAKRDWGWAPDYVRGMWLMLQRDEPGDYVLATGESHSVREFLIAALVECTHTDGLFPCDRLIDPHIKHDEKYERPADIAELRGDASRARDLLGWAPSVGFEDMVRLMVESEVQATQCTQPTIRTYDDRRKQSALASEL